MYEHVKRFAWSDGGTTWVENGENKHLDRKICRPVHLCNT